MRYVRIAALAGALVAALLLADRAWASRNSSGTMSGINGPYTAGSVISSSVINARLSDIETELTASLERSGKGGMLAALRGTDGTVTAPAFAFTSETGTGLYRIGSSDLGVAINQSKKLELTSSLFTITPNASFSGALTGGMLDVQTTTGSTTARFHSSTFPLSIVNNTLPFSGIGFNATHDGANWKYGATNTATAVNHEAGGLFVYSAPSGTAGNTITFTKRLGVTESGVTIGSAGTAIATINTGTGTFNGGTPATFTATVVSGAKCVASKVQTGGAAAVAVSVTTTTLTVTSSAAGDVSTANYFCF